MGDEHFEIGTTGFVDGFNSFDVRSASAELRKVHAQMAVERSRFYFEMLGVTCPFCGKAVEYKETPERLLVCEHILEQLKQQCEIAAPAPAGVRVPVMMGGIHIELF